MTPPSGSARGLLQQAPGAEDKRNEAGLHSADEDADAQHRAVIEFAHGSSIRDNEPVAVSAPSWGAFVQWLDGHRARSKASAGYICGPLLGRRSAEAAAPRRWLAFDLDRIEPDALGEVCEFWTRFSAVRWATHSSTGAAPRQRVIVELARAVTRREAIALGEVIGADLADNVGDTVLLDPSTYRGEQPIFLPPVGPVLAVCSGAVVDVDSYLRSAGQAHALEHAAGPQQRPAAAPPTRGQSVPEGGRHLHLVRLVGTLNSKGLSESAIGAAVSAINATECDPPLPQPEVDKIVQDVLRRYRPQHGQAPTFLPPPGGDEGGEVGEWPDPILPGLRPPPEIPTEVLPSWVGDMAAAVSASTQTPPALAVMVSLAVLATCVQRRFEVAPFADDYTEPLALWTLTGLPSGTRKTAVINALTGPLVYWEKLLRDRLRDDIAKVTAQRAVAKKRIERLLNDAGKASSEQERRDLEAQVQREELDMPPELRAPRLFTGDCTAERLQNLLVEHGERMAVLSDEAGIFLIMAGVYSGGVASLDVFLQGHAGTAMRVDRAGRAAHVDKPSLSFGLALQPGVLSDVAGSRRFRDSGLLARFLFCLPQSNVGQRDVRLHRPVQAGVRQFYEQRVLALLDDWRAEVGKPKTLTLAPDAREAWLDLAERIERAQGEGGKLESISDWTSKLPGATARIAAVLALAEFGLGIEEVPLQSMQRAVRLAELLVPHARSAFALLGADPVDADADAILRWVKTHGLLQFTRREAQKAQEGRFRTVDRLKAALQRLEAQDVVREGKRVNRGAPATVFYDVNPKVLA